MCYECINYVNEFYVCIICVIYKKILIFRQYREQN